MTIPGIYSQRDSRWASNELGFNNDSYYNMYHFGCLVTAISNLMWDAGYGPDPASVNTWLQAHNGFVSGGGNVIWDVAHQLMIQSELNYVGYTSSINDMNEFLAADENNYAIAQLSGSGFPMHFSAVPYVGMIEDSWDATLKPIVGNYTFVGAHKYTKALQAPVAAPVPEAISPTIIVPLPQTTPVTVPSVDTPIVNPNPVVIPPPAPIQEAVTPEVTGTVTGPVSISTSDYASIYTPFPNGVQVLILQRNAFVKDLTGQNAPTELTQGTTTRLAGTLTYENIEYYRGADSANNGTWHVIEKDAYSNAVESAFLGIEEEISLVISRTFNPIAALLRKLGKNNKKG